MTKVHLFRYAAAAAMLTAVAAAVLAVIDGDAAMTVLSATFAALVALVVLADRRALKAAERIRGDLRSVHRIARTLKSVPADIDSVRLQTIAARNKLETELRGARSGLEGLRAEMRGLRGEITVVRAALAEMEGLRTATDALHLELSTVGEKLERARSDAELGREDAKTRDQSLHSLAAAATAQRESHLRTLRWQMTKLHADLVTDTQALYQLFARYAPDGPLPPLAGWALGPVQLAALLNVVERRGARTIVECGSGTSTLWLAYALRAAGEGRLVALEHQAEFAAKTRALVDAHGLTDWVEIRHAPLVPTATPRGEFLWYDVDPDSIEGRIDLLLVDGPPGDTGETARYPALPVLRAKLAPRAFVIVDDVERDDEQKVLDLWREDETTLVALDRVGSSMEVLALGGEE